MCSLKICVGVNQQRSVCLPEGAGVHQGDCLSPSLIAIFINDLASGTRKTQVGIEVGKMDVTLLLCANDTIREKAGHAKVNLILTYIWLQEPLATDMKISNLSTKTTVRCLKCGVVICVGRKTRVIFK